ncbi:hypothetical protein ACFL6S_03455 [Candidatus Poribacteria bacterium]
MKLGKKPVYGILAIAMLLLVIAYGTGSLGSTAMCSPGSTREVLSDTCNEAVGEYSAICLDDRSMATMGWEFTRCRVEFTDDLGNTLETYAEAEDVQLCDQWTPTRVFYNQYVCTVTTTTSTTTIPTTTVATTTVQTTVPATTTTIAECSPGQTQNYNCASGQQVQWCTCAGGGWACIDSPQNQCSTTTTPTTIGTTTTIPQNGGDIDGGVILIGAIVMIAVIMGGLIILRKTKVI